MIIDKPKKANPSKTLTLNFDYTGWMSNKDLTHLLLDVISSGIKAYQFEITSYEVKNEVKE